MKEYKSKKFKSLLNKIGIDPETLILDIIDGSAYVTSNRNDFSFHDGYICPARGFSDFSDIDWICSIVDKIIDEYKYGDFDLPFDKDKLLDLINKSKDSDFIGNGSKEYYINKIKSL